MTTTITTIPSTEALDLRQALALRPAADRIIARLRAGDRNPMLFAEARGLLDDELRMAIAGKAALAAFGHADTQPHRADSPVHDIMQALGTGQLGYELDVAEGRVF